LGTDIIVGFPTETEEDFMQTYHIMQKVNYSAAFIFAYSPRPGTPAMRWKDDISEVIKQDRLQRLLTLHQQICNARHLSLLQSEQEVLIMQESAKDAIHLKGRTRYGDRVIFPGDPSLTGSLQRVIVEGYSNQTLIAKLLETHRETKQFAFN